MLKGRLEDDRMLTGRGRYVSDWNLPGEAHAHFVRSDRAHAEIVSIDKEAALRSPGVLAVRAHEMRVRLVGEVPVGYIAPPTGEHPVVFEPAFQHQTRDMAMRMLQGA